MLMFSITKGKANAHRKIGDYENSKIFYKELLFAILTA